MKAAIIVSVEIIPSKWEIALVVHRPEAVYQSEFNVEINSIYYIEFKQTKKVSSEMKFDCQNLSVMEEYDIIHFTNNFIHLNCVDELRTNGFHTNSIKHDYTFASG